MLRVVSIYIIMAWFCGEACAATFNQSRNHHIIEPGVLGGKGFVLGRGVDMTDPDNWVLAPQTPFLPESMKIKSVNELVIPAASSVQTAGFVYQEDISVRQEAHILHSYFKLSHPVGSLQATVDQVENERKSSRSIYAISRFEGETATIDGGAMWPTSIKSENEPNDQDRVRQFVTDYGSHYISSITNGYSIVIRAQNNNTDQSSVKELSVKLKAGIATLSAGGALSVEDRKYFNQSSVNIEAAISSGGTVPPRPLVLTGMDDVASFLSDWKKGNFKIESAPVRATLTSWWHTLDAFPKTRAALSAENALPPPAPYGVPAGTVLSWLPPGEALDLSDPSNPKVILPSGWSFCPDKMSDKFLYITSVARDAGATGGEPTHSHTFKTGLDLGGTVENIDDGPNKRAAIPGHIHQGTTDPASNIPPYVRVMAICKK